MKINFGCGSKLKTGFLGVDILQLPGVDIVHNLDNFPYPFDDNSVDEIWMDQVLEHLNDPLKTVEELYRISKNDAIITIGVPYFRSFYAYIDPTHKNFFSMNWFNYFDPTHIFCQKYQYSKAAFQISKIEINREDINKSIFSKILIYYAKKKPTSYELRLSHLFPLNSLTFHLKVIK
jgi:predicted SAM-dependent methyltransferase